MLKFASVSQDLLVYNFRLLLIWVGFLETMFFEYSLKNFQGFMLLFSYQCPFCRFVRQLIYSITLSSSCQELFYFSFSI